MFKRLAIEVWHAVPGIIYFWLTFSLIYYTSGLMLPPDTERYYSYIAVCLSAIFVGKVIFVTNLLPFINLFPHRPLIYNITWKLFVYTMMIFVAWILDSFIRMLYLNRNLDITYYELSHDVVSPVFWSSILWLIAAFLIYILFTEISSALGKSKLSALLFG